MKRRLARAVATIGIGRLPGPSGSVAAAAAIPLAYALHRLGGFPALALATLAAAAAGWWAIRIAILDQPDRDKPDLDPREIVVDEVVGQWIALWPLSAGLWAAGAAPQVFPWPGWVAAFVLFRLFDILKPGPVGWADRRPGPVGVLLDDVIAGAMAAAVVAARARGWRIATAESCTGGLVAAALTDIPGSSDVFDRGFIAYAYPAKTAMLGVPEAMLAEHGAVSEPVARAMAEGARRASSAELAIAVTGVAGPGGSDAKPEGLVWFAVATDAGVETARRDFGARGRAAVRQRSVEVALDLALQALTDGP